ncbi:MAG: SURF1 family protein [bacterium]|nr:SURF1 family protein [bacterium]
MVSYTSRSSAIPVSLTVFTLFSILVFLALGFWQLERLEEKQALIQKLTQRLGATPADIKTVLNDSRDLEEYWSWRPVKLTGSWDVNANIFLQTRIHQGKSGVNVVTPFHLKSGPTILVNRGWFPEEQRVRAAQPLPKEPVSLAGFLRVKEDRGSLAPDNRPEKEDWYILDIPEISKHLGLSLAAPFFVIASEEIQGGQPALISPHLPNNHLSYAFTWFALSVAILIAYLIYLKQLVGQRLKDFRESQKKP